MHDILMYISALIELIDYTYCFAFFTYFGSISDYYDWIKIF